VSVAGEQCRCTVVDGTLRNQLQNASSFGVRCEPAQPRRSSRRNIQSNAFSKHRARYCLKKWPGRSANKDLPAEDGKTLALQRMTERTLCCYRPAYSFSQILVRYFTAAPHRTTRLLRRARRSARTGARGPREGAAAGLHRLMARPVPHHALRRPNVDWLPPRASRSNFGSLDRDIGPSRSSWCRMGTQVRAEHRG